MRLAIRSRGIELSPELRDQVLRRIHAAMSRLSPALRRLDVTIADINGPKGGIDKVCRIRARGPGLPELVIEERDADVVVAVDHAAHRTARTLARALEQRRTFAPRLALGW